MMPGWVFSKLGRNHRLDRWAIVAIVLLASVFPVDLFPGGPHGQHGADGQLSGKQGQVLLVHVPVKSGQGPADAAFTMIRKVQLLVLPDPSGLEPALVR